MCAGEGVEVAYGVSWPGCICDTEELRKGWGNASDS